MWESVLKISRTTHRQGVIISQPIQKLSLWEGHFQIKLLVISNYHHVVLLLLPIHMGNEFYHLEGAELREKSGWTTQSEGAWPQGCSDHGIENGHVTCTTHTCSLMGRRVTGSQVHA